MYSHSVSTGTHLQRGAANCKQMIMELCSGSCIDKVEASLFESPESWNASGHRSFQPLVHQTVGRVLSGAVRTKDDGRLKMVLLFLPLIFFHPEWSWTWHCWSASSSAVGTSSMSDCGLKLFSKAWNKGSLPLLCLCFYHVQGDTQIGLTWRQSRAGVWWCIANWLIRRKMPNKAGSHMFSGTHACTHTVLIWNTSATTALRCISVIQSRAERGALLAPWGAM